MKFHLHSESSKILIQTLSSVTAQTDALQIVGIRIKEFTDKIQ